jgi:RNA 3'-terminal phosphate cyclase
VKKFSPDLDITLKINKRGFKPLRGGYVFFSSSTTKYFKAVDITDFGKYKKVKGTDFGAKVSV